MGTMGNSQPVNSGPVPRMGAGEQVQPDRPPTQLEGLCDYTAALEATANTVLRKTEELAQGFFGITLPEDSADVTEPHTARIPCAQDNLATVRACLERIEQLLEYI